KSLDNINGCLAYPVHLFPKHLFQLRLRCGHFPRRQYRKNAYPRAGLFKMVLIKQIIDFISRFHLAKVCLWTLFLWRRNFDRGLSIPTWVDTYRKVVRLFSLVTLLVYIHRVVAAV